ncbi:MAG: hypothetical protein HY830_06710 [Actinobacteria bacterium]|nr:hypothetical protein [Actinomycetota bacterium]
MTADGTAAPSASGTARRVAAAARYRLAATLRDRSFVAPVVTFALVEVLLFGAPGGYPADNVAAALAVGLPVATWAARVVLDVEPDDQRRLTELAAGGRSRAHLAALVAAAVVCLGLLAAGVLWGVLRNAPPPSPRPGRPLPPPQPGLPVVLLVAVVLVVAFGLAAVAVAAVASRQVAGDGPGPVVVLVGVPVLAALVGQSTSPVVSGLLPRVLPAVVAAQDRRLVATAPGLALHAAGWTALVLAAQWWWRRRR